MTIENAGSEPVVNEGDAGSEPKQVSYESHRKLLDQRKADQLKLKTLQDQISAISQERETHQNSSLEEQKKFKDLWENERKKNAALADQFNGLTKSVSESKKRAALSRELGTVKKDEYLRFADFDSIVVGEDGEVDLDSVKDVATRFKRDHSDLLAAAPGKILPSGAPRSPSMIGNKPDISKMSMAELLVYNSEINASRQK